MKIRKATEDDTEVLMDIWEKSEYNKKSVAKMKLAIDMSMRFSENYLVLNPNPIGNFVITNKRDITYLNYINLIKSKQGKGFGKKMLEDVIKIAKENKSKKIQLAVWAKNFRAILLYTKFGFYVSGFKRKFDKELGKKLVMEKMV